MKLRLLFICFISFCCISLIANEKFTLSDQWFFSEKISDEWQMEIPPDAIPFKLINEKCNLDTIRGKKGQEKDACVVYNQFHADQDGKLSIGFGCNWWMQVYCNGIEYYNTMKFGNVIDTFSPWNHPLQIPVKKGNNLLAVKVIRGINSFIFACGSINPPIPDVKPVLEPRKITSPQLSAPGFGSSYQLILLGDTHFDGSSVYHSEYIRNETNWKERMPRLLKAAANQITDKTFAVIQLGDLIQGRFSSPRTTSRMLLDALNAFKSEFGSLPFLTVAGNHDLDFSRGNKEAYREIMLPHLSRELKKEISSTTFYFMKDEDLYLFIPYYDSDYKIIQEAFAKHSNARYKFVITHGPVIPADGNMCMSFWFLFGHNNIIRRYFREIFLKNDVIVLTGHEHCLELLECMTDLGRITQLMAYSEWRDWKKARYVQIADKPGDYGKKLFTGTKSYKNPEGNTDRIQLLKEYQAAVTRYWEADGAGFFRLDVSPGGVVAYYFGGDSRTPSKIIRLR